MIEPTSIVLTGRAYQRRATLEVKGDTLMWRAQKVQVYTVPENIATSTHDVKNVMWLERRGTFGGAVLSALGLVWLAYGNYAYGAGASALALLYTGGASHHPTRFLGLDARQQSARPACRRPPPPSRKALVGRIEQHLLTGSSPSILPPCPDFG